MERSTIAACIARCGGNLSLAAKELGISRGALYRKIEKYNLLLLSAKTFFSI